MSHTERLARLEEKAEAERLRTIPIVISWDVESTEMPPSDAQDNRKPFIARHCVDTWRQ